MADGPDQVTTKGQMTKWEQIYNPPEWLNKGQVTLERGQSLISGGAVEHLGDNRWRISFPPSGVGGGGGGGGGVYALNAGMIMAWPLPVNDEATDLPGGWMVCDGRQLDQAEYAELFGILGLRYTPTAERTGDSFRIPDYRGRTLIGERALDSQPLKQPRPDDDPPYESPLINEGRLDIDGVPLGGEVDTVGSVQRGFRVTSTLIDDEDARLVQPNTSVTWVIKAKSTFPEDDEGGLVFTAKLDYDPDSEMDMAFDDGELTFTIGKAPWEIVQDFSESYQTIKMASTHQAPPPPLNTKIQMLPWQPAHPTLTRHAFYAVHSAFLSDGGLFAAYMELKAPNGTIMGVGRHMTNAAQPEYHWGDVSQGSVIIPPGYTWRVTVEYYKVNKSRYHNRSGVVHLFTPPKLSLKLRDELIPAEENEAT